MEPEADTQAVQQSHKEWQQYEPKQHAVTRNRGGPAGCAAAGQETDTGRAQHQGQREGEQQLDQLHSHHPVQSANGTGYFDLDGNPLAPRRNQDILLLVEAQRCRCQNQKVVALAQSPPCR